MRNGVTPEAPETCLADASPDVPISGTRAQRYQVVLHVEPAALSAEGEPGRAELEDGTRISAETCRRLACDASVVRVTHDRRGSVDPVESLLEEHRRLGWSRMPAPLVPGG